VAAVIKAAAGRMPLIMEMTTNQDRNLSPQTGFLAQSPGRYHI
jgi:hypothetical protein